MKQQNNLKKLKDWIMGWRGAIALLAALLVRVLWRVLKPKTPLASSPAAGAIAEVEVFIEDAAGEREELKETRLGSAAEVDAAVERASEGVRREWDDGGDPFLN